MATNTYTLYLASSDSVDSGYSTVTYNYGFQLKDTVAIWYRRLLIFAIVGMMSVLVYIGIRMTLSSVSSQKAKYKQMLGDWFVGMILLFSMHYIMVFSNLFANKLTDVLKGATSKVYLEFLEDRNEKIESALRDSRFIIVNSDANIQATGTNTAQYIVKKVEDGKSYLMMPTNMMGKLRYDARYNKENSEGYIGYTVLYIIMICYLVIYVYIYFKRVVIMAFLTMIAPLVALTYPIDKVTDGKAQGFSTWFKEYIFNLLLQPLHLLLYTILVGSAIQLATENTIYAIVVLGFMAPAEKLLRQMFNFQKASTPGIFAGAAGAGLAMSGMKWLMGRGKSDKSDSKENEDESIIDDGTGKRKVNFAKTFGGESGEKPKEGKKTMNPQAVGTVISSVESKAKEGAGNIINNNPLVSSETESEKNQNNKTLLLSENETGEEQNNNSLPSLNDNNEMMQEENPPINTLDEQMKNWDDDELKNNIDLQKEKVKESMYGNREGQKLKQMQDELDRRNSNNNAGSIPIQKEEPEPELTPKEIRKERRQKIKNGAKDGFDIYKAYRKEKFKRDLASGKPIRKIARMTTGALGAATFGTAAVGIGMASGDFTKVGGYTTAALAGGYSLGAGESDRISRNIQGDGALDAAIKEYRLSTEDMQKLKEQKDEEILRKAMKNSKLQRKYRETFNETKEQYEKWVKDYYMLYHDNKISDDEMVKLEKFARTDENGLNDTNAREKTILAATTRKRRGLNNLNTYEQKKEAKSEFTKQLRKDKIPENIIEEQWKKTIRFNEFMNQ